MAQQPRQQRIGIYGKFTPTALDTSEAGKMRALAGLGQTIADTSLSIAKPMVTAERAEQGIEAVKEGAGKIDEQTGEVLESPTINAAKFGASQYKQAAQQALAEKGRNAAAAYQSAFRTDTKEAIAQAKIDFKDDPVGFQNWTKSFTEGSLSSINDPAMKAQANEYISERTFDHQLKLQETFDNKLLNEQIATVTTEAQNAYDEAERLIISGDAIGARMEFDTAITGLQEVARMNPNFDVESAVAQIERDYDSLQLKASVSDAADSGDFPAANEMLIEARKEIPKNFTEAQWEQAVNKAQSALVKQKSLFDSTKQVATNEDKAFFKNGVTLLESGKSISVADRDRMNQIAGDDPVKQKAIITASNTSVFIAMPQSQQNELLNSLDDTDPDNVDQIKSYLMASNNIQKSLRADSWGTAIQQNTITEEELADFAEFDVTRLLETNLTDAERADYQQAYQRNKEIAARLSEHYGFTFAPLDNQQIQILTNAIPEMTPGEQVELAESIGPDSPMLNILSEKNATLFAVAATIENSNTQRAIFEGQQLLSSGSVDPYKDVADAMRTQLFEVVGDTLGDVARGQTYEAAKAYYASTFVGENIVYDPGDFANAIEMITGKIRNARGVKTIPPSYSEGNNDGTVDNLEGFIDDMDLETFLELGGEADPYIKTLPVVRSDIQFSTPTPVTVEADRNLERMQGNDYKIRAAFGKNNYKFVTTQGIALKGADGNPLVINVNEERMNAYVAQRNAERMKKYGSFLESDRFARDVMGLFEPEGSPYFEATKAEEFTSTGQFVKELLTLGGLDGDKRTPVNQGMTRPDGSVKSEVGYLGPIVRDDGGVMTEYSTNVDDINAAFADSKFSHIDERGIKVVDFPTLVPTLTKEEVETLRTLPEGERVPKEIIIKAADHAAMKLKQGKSPFYQGGK